MRNSILFLSLVSLFQNLRSQPSMELEVEPGWKPVETTILYKLGESTIPIVVSRYGDGSGLTMINLHADEVTSIAAARRWLAANGGTLVRIENKQKRNIRFRYRGKNYQFDPNRIFSRLGITSTLQQLSKLNEGAIEETEKFGKRILQLLPPNATCIVALHNNTEGAFSIQNYFKGSSRELDAKKVYSNASKDPDDLFLTTDSLLFTGLSLDGYNIVWQDNVNVKKDGSLSVYCGERGIRYINCETQHGKAETYFEMLSAACSRLEIMEDPIAEHPFVIEVDSIYQEGWNEDIYFGNRVVGKVHSYSKDPASGKIVGNLVMKPDFPLYTNLDFFLTGPVGSRKWEARFDPTREKKLVGKGGDIIKVNVL